MKLGRRVANRAQTQADSMNDKPYFSMIAIQLRLSVKLETFFIRNEIYSFMEHF